MAQNLLKKVIPLKFAESFGSINLLTKIEEWLSQKWLLQFFIVSTWIFTKRSTTWFPRRRRWTLVVLVVLKLELAVLICFTSNMQRQRNAFFCDERSNRCPFFFTTQIYCPHPSLSKSWMQCSPSQDAIACGASECFEVGMCHEAIFLGSGGTTCIPKSYVVLRCFKVQSYNVSSNDPFLEGSNHANIW